MKGYVDLHCHYLPGIDDGVRTMEEGVELCLGLARLGYAKVVATPHMRTALFENSRSDIERTFQQFQSDASEIEDLPELDFASEHYLDDVFWARFEARLIAPYPGGHAALVELPPESFPLGIERRFFAMNVRRVRPVLAHPERYAPLFRASDAIDPLLDVGVLPLLDLMSLVGRYGRAPARAAERMLEEGVYFGACSDAHRPSDVALVGEALLRLRALVGEDEADELLRDNPRRILDGRFD
jgi:protein-tyrosine phosphatase